MAHKKGVGSSKNGRESHSKRSVSYTHLDNEPMPGIEYEYAMMNQLAPNIPVAAINQVMQQLITDNNQVDVYKRQASGGAVVITLKDPRNLPARPAQGIITYTPLGYSESVEFYRCV